MPASPDAATLAGAVTEDEKTAGEEAPHRLARSFYESLLDSQWYSAEHLEKYQEAVLTDFIKEVTDRFPWYRNRLDMLLNNGRVELARWGEVPLLSRQELTGHYGELTSENIPSSHGQIKRARTSGSSGPSLAILNTSLGGLAGNAAVWRHNHDHGVDWSRDIAFLRQSIGPQDEYNRSTAPWRKWGPPWMDGDARGWMHRRSVHCAVGEQIAWLASLGRVYLNTYPSNLLRIARAVARKEAPKPDLIAVLAAGEHASEEVRGECRTHLGAEVIDLYSTGECGIIATDCPEGHGYHLLSELARIEILRPDGTACGIGEQGEVVATPLYNLSMPLVRYRTNDRATLLGPCPCGRGQPLISREIGRDSAMIKASGSFRYPALKCEEMERYLGRCRWQLVQLAHNACELRYMQTPSGDEVDEAGAAALVERTVGGVLQVSVREVDAVGQSASGKIQAISLASPDS